MRSHCKLRQWIAIAGLAMPAQAALASDPSTVWIFTADRLPTLQHVEQADRLFVLDHADTALRGLSFNNPSSEVQARQRAMAIIQSPKGQAAIDRMRNSAEAIAVAWQHGIQKLPAVLVDERYVVYGVYDVESALAWVARYRDAR